MKAGYPTPARRGVRVHIPQQRRPEEARWPGYTTDGS
jgi:hypothetical protein